MMRPRLPAINGPGLATSVFVMTFFQSWCARAAWAQPLSALGLDTLQHSGSAPHQQDGARGRAGLPSRVAASHDQGGIGAAEAEAVRHDTVKVRVVLAPAYDGHVGKLRIQLVDIGALA